MWFLLIEFLSHENHENNNKLPGYYIIASACLGSCRKIEQLPPDPALNSQVLQFLILLIFLGTSAKGGRLKFYFEDGDGDLGLQDPVGNQTDSTNLFFTLFRKIDGKMVLAPPNDPLRPS